MSTGIESYEISSYQELRLPTVAHARIDLNLLPQAAAWLHREAPHDVTTAKLKKRMVGTWGLEPQTSTVSRVLVRPLQQLTWRRETAKYPQRRVRQTNHGWDLWGRIDWKSRCFSVHWNLHPDCELPGICPFCANSTWCENSSNSCQSVPLRSAVPVSHFV
jgi:hypothetical protein